MPVRALDIRIIVSDVDGVWTDGKIIYAGSSNFAGWHIAKAQGVARERKFMGLVSEQSLYNLLARHIELEVLPAAADFGGLLRLAYLG